MYRTPDTITRITNPTIAINAIIANGPPGTDCAIGMTTQGSNGEDMEASLSARTLTPAFATVERPTRPPISNSEETPSGSNISSPTRLDASRTSRSPAHSRTLGPNQGPETRPTTTGHPQNNR